MNFIVKIENVEDNNCIFDQEQLYYGMPELWRDEYVDLFDR